MFWFCTSVHTWAWPDSDRLKVSKVLKLCLHSSSFRQTNSIQVLVERIIGEGNGNPLQCSCLEDPRDRGAWWAPVYGVAQSRTRLKWLSSSSRENNLEAVAQVEGSRSLQHKKGKALEHSGFLSWQIICTKKTVRRIVVFWKSVRQKWDLQNIKG